MAVPIKQVFIRLRPTFISWCLNGFKVKGKMVVNINGSNPADFKAPPGSLGTARPIPANPGSMLPCFTDITGIESNDKPATAVRNGQVFIEPHKVKGFFKLLPIPLFCKLSRIFRTGKSSHGL